jgi:hypothetical protein
MSAEPECDDVIIEAVCLGELEDYLRSGARPLRRFVVRHKTNGPLFFEAEYVKEHRDERGLEYIRLIVRNQRGEEVILGQFCKPWIDSIEDQGPIARAS